MEPKEPMEEEEEEEKKSAKRTKEVKSGAMQQSESDAAMTPAPGKRLVKKTREKIGSDGFSCMRYGGREG